LDGSFNNISNLSLKIRTIFLLIAVSGLFVGTYISDELGFVMVGGSLVLSVIDDRSWKMFRDY